MSKSEINDYFGPKHRFVIELKPEDFDENAPWRLKPRKETGKLQSGMVLFYAPWCDYCKKVKEPWIKAAKTTGFCDFYAFNCEKYKNHLSKIKSDMPQLIRGFPTIIIYNDGEPNEYYKGERTVESFVKECMIFHGN